MNGWALVLTRKRLILAVAALMALAGLGSWLTMPRQEDPRLPERFAFVVASFPGADAETVERLVVEPIEERFAELTEIKETRVTIRAGVAITTIELEEDVYDTDAIWDDVRRELVDASTEFPEGVPLPRLHDDTFDQESVVVALTGPAEFLELVDAAEELKKALLTLPLVKQVNLVGDPGEQITIALDDAATRRFGVSPGDLAHQLGERNRVLPGGTIRLGDRHGIIDPKTDFSSIDEIRGTPIQLRSGIAVPFVTIAEVSREPRVPLEELFRHNGQNALGLAIVPKEDIDILAFGRQVRSLLQREEASLAPLALHEVFFQPDRVSHRLDTLGRSLLFGILIVAGLLIIAMGARLGFVVATIIPLVALASLGIWALGGGVLHQMSISALVIALGMLVDNAIVVAERVQAHMDGGLLPNDAAIRSVSELALPLGSATGTTLAAFVPMLIAAGTVADFTRAIPVVIMLTLSVSYVFAVLVTPSIASMVLRPSRDGGRTRLLPVVGEWAGTFAVKRSWLVVLAALALVAGSVISAAWVEKRFFPSADRNQVVIDMTLPDGTPIESTLRRVVLLEELLREMPDVDTVASFVGRAAPRFYYNITQQPSSPHFAQFVAATHSPAEVDKVIAATRRYAQEFLPEAEIVARALAQGPPVEAPIEVRIHGSNFAELDKAARRVVGLLREIEGSADLRHDLDPGVAHLEYTIDDAVAARRGITRADVARTLIGHTLGIEIGRYRAARDPVPILVRSSAGENFPAQELAAVDVVSAMGLATPLGQVARERLTWRPAVIHHIDRSRVVTVLSELEPGYTYSNVVAELLPRLDELDLPPGVSLRLGGEAAESADANAAILRGMPLGILLLVVFLLAEFNSFRRLAIILATVPLAATGVVPGLLVSGQPFGFMSMLGVIALVGIVVNNAIVLLDVVERQRGEGARVEDAIVFAVQERIRPILITTLTTVAGLLPLALSPASLWPPLAWAIISGLLASTLLTLVVVPALYALLLGSRPPRSRPKSRAALTLAGRSAVLFLAATTAFGVSRAAEAEPTVTLQDAIVLAADRPAAEASKERSHAADSLALATRRAAWLPKLGAEFSATGRDRELELETPLGAFPLGSGSYRSAGVEVVQPLIDLVHQRYLAPAARREAAAARLSVARSVQLLSAEAASAVLELLSLEALDRATLAYITSMEAQADEASARVAAGVMLKSDFYKIRVALDRARQDLRKLRNMQVWARERLGVTVGIAGPVRTVDPGDLLLPPLPSLEEAVLRAMKQRPDLAALSESTEALSLRAKGIRAESLPRLEARARWLWSDSGQYTNDSWTEGALTLSWHPFAAATRAPRQAAMAAESRALAAEGKHVERGLRLEISMALSGFDTARAAEELGASAVEEATQTLRVEKARHEAGRATTNDLLDAEAVLLRERSARDLASLDRLHAWARLQLAMGTPLEQWFPGTSNPRSGRPQS